MKFYQDFSRSGQTFEERTGEPDSFSAAIGRVTLAFSELDGQLSLAISKVLSLDEEIGRIITCELAFKSKVHMLTSIVRHLAPTKTFNAGDADAIEMFSELMVLCFRAEELRNQIMHSSWIGPYLRDAQALRRKVTAKASKGLTVHEEDMDAGYLLDIADFVICVAMDIEEFFFEVNDVAEQIVEPGRGKALS